MNGDHARTLTPVNYSRPTVYSYTNYRKTANKRPRRLFEHLTNTPRRNGKERKTLTQLTGENQRVTPTGSTMRSPAGVTSGNVNSNVNGDHARTLTPAGSGPRVIAIHVAIHVAIRIVPSFYKSYRNNPCKVKNSYRPTTLSFLSVSSKKSRYPCFYKMVSDVN